MKKTKIILLSFIMLFVIAVSACGMMACKDDDINDDIEQNTALTIEQVYAYAQEAGFTGTLDELVAMFKGSSAYELAVKNGFSGTEQEWLLSLAGKNGKDGVSPTIEIDSYGYWVINGVRTDVYAKADNAGTSSYDDDIFDFYLTDDDTYYVSFERAKYLSEITIPSMHNGKPVVGIDDFGSTSYIMIAMEECCKINKVTIPYGLKSIGMGAFACTSIESIEIPDSVESIGAYAFWNNNSLKSIKLSSNLTEIAENTFYECDALEYINIPEGVQTIGREAFCYCENLKSIVLPKTLKTIDEDAFYEDDDLENIFFSGSAAMWDQIDINHNERSFYDKNGNWLEQDSGNRALNYSTVYYAGEWHMENGMPVIDYPKTTKANSSISVCTISDPSTLDPALSSTVERSTLIVHLFSGLVKYNEDGELVADCAEALPTPIVAENGEATYVFKLRSGLKWSNGDELKASDFEYSWKRAASEQLGANSRYMFEVIKGYGEADINGLAPLAVVANDNVRTITVTTNALVPYFFELCAFPTFMPVHRETVEANQYDWASSYKLTTDSSSLVCNGAYVLNKYSNQLIKLTKNIKYHDADSITMGEIKFYFTDSFSSSDILDNYKNGEWLMIDDVPTDEIATLKTEYPEEFNIIGQLGTYYCCFNNNVNFVGNTSWAVGKTTEEIALANAEVRKAISLLIDRNYICEEICQAGQQPASSFVALGITDTNGKEFYENAGHNDGYIGYYNLAKSAYASNCTAAVNTLKKYFTYVDGKFTDIPGFTYLYNTSDDHKAIAEAIQAELGTYGITMTLQNQEWNTFIDTRDIGDYGLARNGWLGDYNDPISFLDMWTTQSGNNDVQYGRSPYYYYYFDFATNLYDASDLAIYNMDLSGISGYEHRSVENGTWAETYDVLISWIKSESDTITRYQLMHVAEDILMSTGDIVPLYYYTDIYMISSKVSGFFASPLGYKYFMYTTISK